MRLTAYKLTLMVLAVVLPAIASAQGVGRVAGRVVSNTGAPLLGASVSLQGTELTTSSDLDGRYLLTAVPEGTYNVVFNRSGYRESVAEGLVVVAGETAKLDFLMPLAPLSTNDNLIELETFTVSATIMAGSDVGLLAQRSTSVTVTDAIGTDMMSRLSISDAADALKRLPGLSVTDGKYAVIRGLGDRFGNTTLNGVTMPSPDPDRQAVQLDIFPSELLDSVTSSKTFTPDLPSNSAGGTVQLKSKSFPEERMINMSVSFGYNENSTWNDDFVNPQSESKDIFARGSEDRPFPADAFAGYPRNSQAEFQRSNSYLREAAPVRGKADPNYGFDVGYGDSWQVGEESRLGLIFGFTYDHTTDYVEQGTSNEFFGNDLSTGLLSMKFGGKYDNGTEEVLHGELLGLAFQFNPENEISFNLFNVMSGTNEAQVWRGWKDTDLEFEYSPENPDYDPTAPNFQQQYRSLIYYLERRLTNGQLSGKHANAFLEEAELDWNLSMTGTNQKEPEVRRLRFTEFPNTTPTPIYDTSATPIDPERYFRNLTDSRQSVNVNYKIPFDFNSLTANFKTGFTIENTEREYVENNIIYAPRTLSRQFNSLSAFDSYYDGVNTPAYVPLTARETGVADGERKVRAAYAMFELPMTESFRMILGARFDQTNTNMKGSGAFQGAPPGFRSGTTDNSDENWLPSLTGIYAINSEMNIRAAYSRTVAFPSMRELTRYFSQFLPGEPVIVGNPDLTQSTITSYDLRWEWFTEDNGIVAASIFAKEIENPIERNIILDSTAGGGEIITSWKNNANAAILKGIELEARRSFGFISESLENLTLGINITYIDATVDLDPDERAAKIRLYGNREELVPTSRRLEGQPEWVFNSDLTYKIESTGTQLTLAVYWISDRLDKVSNLATFDTYSQSYEQLDFIVSQRITDNMKIKFSAKNLTAPSRDVLYDPAETSGIFVESSYETARTYSLSVSYEF